MLQSLEKAGYLMLGILGFVNLVAMRFYRRARYPILWLFAIVSLLINVRLFIRGKGYYNKIRIFLRERNILRESDKEHEADLQNPERLAVLPYCVGTGIDVGCGNRKSADNAIGVDILAKGTIGHYGCVAAKASVADVCASGDDMPMFADDSLDFVVARHNLEHYVDVIKTLQEWKRVLKVGGVMALILPDERALNTIAIDPTHKHAFTPESFGRYIALLGGMAMVKTEAAIPNWSFLVVCRKTAD